MITNISWHPEEFKSFVVGQTSSDWGSLLFFIPKIFSAPLHPNFRFDNIVFFLLLRPCMVHHREMQAYTERCGHCLYFFFPFGSIFKSTIASLFLMVSPQIYLVGRCARSWTPSLPGRRVFVMQGVLMGTKNLKRRAIQGSSA